MLLMLLLQGLVVVFVSLCYCCCIHMLLLLGLNAQKENPIDVLCLKLFVKVGIHQNRERGQEELIGYLHCGKNNEIDCSKKEA